MSGIKAEGEKRESGNKVFRARGVTAGLERWSPTRLEGLLFETSRARGWRSVITDFLQCFDPGLTNGSGWNCQNGLNYENEY